MGFINSLVAPLAALVKSHNPGLNRWVWGVIVVLAGFVIARLAGRIITWVVRAVIIVAGILIAWQIVK